MSSSRSRPWVRLVMVRLRQPRIDGRIAWDQAVDVGEPEEPTDTVHHRVDRGVHQPAAGQVPDVQLDVRSLDPDQRVEGVALAPGEPPAKLVGVERVGVTRVPGQVRDSRQLGRRHRVGLEREQGSVRHGNLIGDVVTKPHPRIAAHTVRHLNGR
jgi:hypothetical protein